MVEASAAYIAEGLDHPKTLAVLLEGDHIEYDTHGTDSEHATKEIGAWRSFLEKLRQVDAALPLDIDDPVDHYMYSGRGIFSRVYSPNNTLLAGMAISARPGGILELDAMYCVDAEMASESQSSQETLASQVATGVNRMITRNVLDIFCGVYGHPRAKQFSLSFEKMGRNLQPDPYKDYQRLNWGLLRGITDFALATTDSFVIPLPGQAIRLGAEPVNQEKLQDFKALMPRDWVGILEYNEAADPKLVTSELYRKATLVGRTTLRYAFPKPNVFSVMLADGTTIHSSEMREPNDYSVREVRALKTIAQIDPHVAELILS